MNVNVDISVARDNWRRFLAGSLTLQSAWSSNQLVSDGGFKLWSHSWSAAQDMASAFSATGGAGGYHRVQASTFKSQYGEDRVNLDTEIRFLDDTDVDENAWNILQPLMQASG